MAVGYYYEHDFRSLEDKLTDLARKVSDVRKGFSEGEITELRLQMNTFIFYVSELEKLAIDIKAGYDKQKKVEDSVRETAARKKAAAADKAKKRG